MSENDLSRPRPAEPGFDGAELAEDEEGSLHLTELWEIVLRRKLIVVAAVLVALVTGVVVSFLSPPLYRARSVVYVERDRSNPLEAASMPQFVGYDPEFLPTQVQLIRGREIAERVVEQLALVDNPSFNPRRSGYFSEDGEAGREVTEEEVTSAAERVQNGIDVVPIRGTSVIQLFYTAPAPELAADIVNALSTAYIDWSVEARFHQIGQASRFLSSQIEQVRAEVEQKSRQLQEYGDAKDILSIDETNVTMQNLEQLNKDYAAAVADRVAREARYHEAQTGNAEAIAETVAGNVIAQLRADQAKFEKEYAEKLNLYKPSWPAMQELRGKIEKGNQDIQNEIARSVVKARDVARGDYLTALRREENLKSVLGGIKRDAMTLNRDAVEFNNLQIEVGTKRALLDNLLARQAEIQMMERSRSERASTVRVVETARAPKTRFKPSYRKNMTVSLFLGLMGGIGIIFFLEYWDRSLRTPEQVSRVLRLPTLGVIPSAEGNRSSYGYYGALRGAKKRKAQGAVGEFPAIELLPHRAPRSTISEAYRSFRTALLLSQPGGVRNFAVTSTLAGEGKTSTAINTAVALSQLGRRVLIIDADLHRPRMHELFHVSARSGLVSILAGNVKPSAAILETSVPGVFLIPAGPTAPNPSRLIASPVMRQLLELARSEFDHVIVDTPPVSLVADSMLIASQCDGVVLCVQAHRTARNLVLRARDEILRARVEILGVLLNNVGVEGQGYDAYRYYSTYYGESAKNGRDEESAAASSGT